MAVKVLFVYRYLTLGGVETVIHARIIGLLRMNIDARAWFLSSGDGITLFRSIPDKIYVGHDVSALRAIQRSKFDVVTAIDTPEGFMDGSLIGAAHRVLECHSPYLENLDYLKSAQRLGVNDVLVPSDHQERIVKERVPGSTRVHIVPNPVGEHFCGPISDVPSTPRKPIVAWIGRMDELKNWRGFLEILNRLERQGVEYEAWLAGEFPYGGDWIHLYRAAHELGVLPSLRWYKGVEHRKLPRWLDLVRQSGGVLLSTSKGDSFGMTLAEAMARSCTVAAPRRSPFTEFINHGRTGLLYDDPAEASSLILQVISGELPYQEIGRAAREHILKYHAPERALHKLSDFLTTLLPVETALDPATASDL